MNEQEIFKITGMSCAACSAKVERRLNKLAHIAATVNLATERAVVQFDSDKTSVAEIVNIINDLGYKAQIATEVSRDQEKDQREREILRLRTELIMAAILSLPLILAMLLALVKPDATFLHNDYFQLAIATAMQLSINTRFYRNAYRALCAKSANMDVLIAIGISAAYFLSLYNVFFQQTSHGMMKDLYFEAAAVIVTFVLLGKYLEAVAKDKASEAIKKLMGLQAKTARVIRDRYRYPNRKHTGGRSSGCQTRRKDTGGWHCGGR